METDENKTILKKFFSHSMTHKIQHKNFCRTHKIKREKLAEAFDYALSLIYLQSQK